MLVEPIDYNDIFPGDDRDNLVTLEFVVAELPTHFEHDEKPERTNASRDVTHFFSFYLQCELRIAEGHRQHGNFVKFARPLDARIRVYCL
jgi:hypothetical protein